MICRFIAQRGICWGMSQLHRLILDVAFTIEGREESELPECALSSVSISKMPLPSAIDESALFSRSKSHADPATEA